MATLIAEITKALKEAADPAYKAGAKQFFKEDINPLGVKVPTVRKIARTYFPKGKEKEAVLALCEELLTRKTQEHSIIAFAWMTRLEKQFIKDDFSRFEAWVDNYVSNWALCDDLCCGSFGKFLLTFPACRKDVLMWATSKNMWKRRAAAVSLIYSARRKDKTVLPYIWKTADSLLQDKEDLVQKGYGWMLKEASNTWPADVFSYVMTYKNDMPRTALRYAIEKYPQAMRKEAMK